MAKKRKPPEPFLQPRELAAAINRSIPWVSRAARERRIPCYELAPRLRRYRLSEVRRALALNGQH